jgi:hypothetical protein
MNLAEIWRIILKRWYIAVPMLLVAVALTGGVYQAIPVQYESTSMISLLASQQATKGTVTLPGTENPFSNFDSSLNDTADFLTRRVDSSDDALQLAAQGVTGKYSETLAASQGPFILLTVQGPTAATAQAEMSTLINYTAQALESLQQEENVPAVDMIRSDVIVPGSEATAQTKTRLQDTLGAGAGGLALAILVTLAVNSVFESRRRGRRPGRLRRLPRAAARPGVDGPGGDGLEPDAVSAGFDALTDPRDLLDSTRAALISPLPDARD